MSESILATHKLKNGLEIVFHDSGNRYFGDYHQVKLMVHCRIPLNDDLLSEHLADDDLKKAIQLFGDHVEYRKLLKQMGVAGNDVDDVKQALIDNFMKSAADYMQGEDFASRYVARRLVEHRNRNRLHLVGYD